MSDIDFFARQENEVLKREKHELQHKIIDLRKSKEELQAKIDKAIEYIKELLSDTKGIIKDYSFNKKGNELQIELLEEDKEIYEKLLEILGDKE